MLENPIIVSDEEINVGTICYLPDGSIRTMDDNDMIDYLDSLSDATNKVIAGLPKLSSIDWNDL